MPETVLAAVLAVASTVAVFGAAVALYRRTRFFLLNPVLVSIAVLVGVLLLLGIPYERYHLGGRLLGFLLGPAVVALGVPLHLQLPELVRRGRAIGVSLLCGSVVGVLVGTVVAALLGAPAAVARSVAPRSVTTPIAMEIAAQVGGIPPLAAVLVILSGVAGAAVGIPLLRVAGVRSRTATGLAMGASAHGIGTARAAEEGMPEAASAGLAIGLMGVLTAVLAPVLLWLLARVGVLP
jgi:predicted murein hydrolase (TIGR00659 family)